MSKPPRRPRDPKVHAMQMLAYAELIGATRVGIVDEKSVRVMTLQELRVQAGLA